MMGSYLLLCVPKSASSICPYSLRTRPVEDDSDRL